ncbi:hypothetical protein LSTR_LSTR002990 [Laodelphax striatellus]|uniref:NOC3-like protein n=1 Tax=Laodelphax striatellus TaxID=195883 RepID=A0A482WS72_LAOST|nr:hypothetical protein LSTR_LSTR002990 [Laodelphax striatellus]
MKFKKKVGQSSPLNDESALEKEENDDEFNFGSSFIRDDSSDNDVSSDDNDSRKPKKRKRSRNLEDEYIKRLEEDDGRNDDELEHANKKKRYLLPVKSGSKLIRRVGFIEEKREVENEDANGELEAENDVKEKEDEIEEESATGRDLSVPVSAAEMIAWREKALAKVRFRIGLLATAVLEDPQQQMSKVNNLKTLNEMAKEYRQELAFSVKKLAIVSLAEIFKDILPSYHIRQQDTSEIKLKKDVYTLQNYEKLLLKNYREFLTKIEKFISILNKKKGDTRLHSTQTVDLGMLCLKLICDLLVSHPYFNYSQNIAQLLVLYLNNPKTEVRSIVSKCLSQIFRQDKKGELSLFIVRKINLLVKSRTNAVHSEVVSVFLSLRIKEVNLDQEKEAELREKKFQTRRQKLLSMSKKERKASKRLEQLEKELLETKAEENKQTKHKTLTEVIKVVFTVYFRILKNDPTSKLLCSTLEGIAKFAHLINLEFYQDLVLVLSRLMDEGNLGLRQRLLCIQTVFTILSGIGESLAIDPTNFYTHLYRNMLLVDAGHEPENIRLVLDSLEIVVLKRRKRITRQRLLAFSKRLGTLALQLQHNGSLSCLTLIKQVVQLNKAVDILLESDASIGQGIFLPELEDPEHCNAASSCLFELTSLRRHYHPVVCKMSDHLMKNLPTTGEGTLAPEIGKLSSREIFNDYNPLEMAFKPAIPAPKKIKVGEKPHRWHDKELEVHSIQAFQDQSNIDLKGLFEEVKKNGLKLELNDVT